MTTIVLLSGGIDSTTLLHDLRAREYPCIAVSFSYRQMHAKELIFAAATARRLEVEHRIIEFPDIFSGSALMGDKLMPEGHYTDASMRQTIVPNRNMVFLAVATSIAIQRGASTVAYAAHADDFGTYPDCREPFVESMRNAIMWCDFSPPELWVPYLFWSKRQIVERGRKLGIDYALTWSCYQGGDEPCGKCGACSARNEALA